MILRELAPVLGHNGKPRASGDDPHKDLMLLERES